MKAEQKLYDAGFNTITGVQQLNPFPYFRSLQLIATRKTQYPSFDKFNIKRIERIPYKDYFVIESNKKYKNKIIDWRQKPVIPKINKLYLELDKRIKINKEKIKISQSRALTLENNKYNIRVKNQRPNLLKADFLKKLFLENHNKYLELLLRNSRFRKKPGKSSDLKRPYVKLPSISGYRDGLFTNMHSKTEYNLDENDQSRDNSIEQKDHKHKEISHQKQGYDEKQNY